ncbi:hypothetical protein CKO15_08810 [Halorhodospira abdelmalekii]|uniref:DUF1998 domain-containing protein n=1 Tax=Halorhodospira abdelmalekii TaxID=421629 RepID=UPI001A9290E7|nr:DUF1998 domain-containing protein [Halorhodospira abdelmalekii]MBK1735381.1 hypothetical protein [Halorhodospira abdelmalekii]
MTKPDEYLPVRLSHLLRHCSVGTVVRGPDSLMAVPDIREWTNSDGSSAGREIFYVERVRSALEIEQVLREPPTAQITDKATIEGTCIPALRFPFWMRCVKCGLLHYKPWANVQTGEQIRCKSEECNGQVMEQVAWVLAHQDGHLADVPWHDIAHSGASGPNQRQCKPDPWGSPYLKIESISGPTRVIVCQRCRATAPFDNARVGFNNNRRQPWLNERVDDAEGVAEIVEVNDARVHTPATASALVIPPESRVRKGSVVDRLYRSSSKRMRLERAKTSLAQKTAIKTLASELRCSTGEIHEALCELKNGYPLYGESMTPGLLLESEYNALLDELPGMMDDEDFVTRHWTSHWQQLSEEFPPDSSIRTIIGAVGEVISVTRLKEIMILKGFSRMNGPLVLPDIVGQSEWLPALELYGEGIFLSLNQEALQKWETLPAVKERAEHFLKRFAETGLQFEPEVIVTPRFMLLHTLSHLMIRELESEAGYPAASLKERIYCSTGGERPMAGILIYVAVPDIAGSLGGLAEMAAPERLLQLLSRAFDHAQWCSLDPVCSEHEGQGPGLLNRAACHACALIPEPACAYGNVLLDRTFVKGDSTAGIPPFLSTAAAG